MTPTPLMKPTPKPRTNLPLKIIQWNVGSIRTKKDYLIFLSNEYNPDVLFINETWLKAEHSFHLRGYKVIREDRDDGYGGIASLIKSDTSFRRVVVNNSYLPNKFQYIAIQVSNVTLINVYCPPDSNIYPKTWERFVKSFFGQIIILGDLNAHHPDWDTSPTNRSGRTIHSTLDDVNLIVMNDGTPTRFRHSETSHTSAVDLGLCSPALAQVATWAVLRDPGHSDHFPIQCTVRNQMPHSVERPCIPKRQTAKANWELYRETLAANSNTLCTSATYADFEHAVNTAADISIPTAKPVSSHKISVPWWDAECSLAMDKRREALKTFSNNTSLNSYLTAKASIAEAHKLFKKKKRDSFRSYCNSLNRNSSISRVWRFFRNMSRSYCPQPPSSLPPSEVAVEILNGVSGCNIVPDFQPDPNILDYEPFIMDELSYTLSQKRDTATGLDNITYSMIRNLPEGALAFLLDFYSKCMQGLQLPPSWKTHLICPILKPSKDPTLPDSYRPIALSSCVGKTFESLIKNRLEWYIENSAILSELLSAFRKGRSVVDNVNYLSSYVQLSFSRNQFTLAVFLDIKSAFDSVDLYSLYNTLINLNIPSNVCNMVFNLFHGRQTLVRDCSGTVHGPSNVTMGLPQGSPLSPYLFNIYMHGINSVIPLDASIVHYADDLLLLLRGCDIPALVNQMNFILEDIQAWFMEHNLEVSMNKSSALLFRKRTTHMPPTNIKYNGVNIPWKTTVRYLGVVFHTSLSWTEHVRNACDKASKGLNLMRAAASGSWGADPAILRTIYYGLVRSHLDYCCQILQPLPKFLTTQLDRTQFKALRIITGCMKSTPTNVLQAECAEPSLDHRRKWLAIKFMVKLVRIPSHPLTNLLHELRPYCIAHQGYWRNKAPPLLVLALETVQGYSTHFPDIPTLPCFYTRLGYQLTELNYTRLKLEKNNDNQQAFLNLLKSQWPDYSLVYTDASRDNVSNKSGIGVYIPDLCIEYAARLPSNTQIYTAEIIAIQKACSYVAAGQLSEVVICSDSLTALQMIADAKYSASNHHVALKTKKAIIDLQNSGTRVELVWLPSHTNIQGNDKADSLAKRATTLTTYLNYSLDPLNYLPKLKNKLWEQWLTDWQRSVEIKGRWYAGFQAVFPKDPWFAKFPFTDRRHITTIIRMRTGHCLTNEHKFRIGLSDTPQCECGQVEDLNHLIFDCPINEIPDFDLYRELVTCNIPTPINIGTLISDLNLEASIVLARYLKGINLRL